MSASEIITAPNPVQDNQRGVFDIETSLVCECGQVG
jgi:hypothetical protein